MNNSTRLSKLRTAGVVATVAALGFVTTATPAFADSHAIVGTVSDLNPTDIDMSELGKVTVTKPAPSPFDTSDKIKRDIAGRTLVLQRLGGLEINTVAGFERAQSLSLIEAQKLPVEQKYQKVTDAQGVAVFDGLKPGLYVLGEPQPEDRSKDYYTTSPELFTVPVGDGDYWSYDFTLESKDQLEKAPKPAPPQGEPSSSGSSVIPLLIPIIIGGIALGSASSVAYVPPAPKATPPPMPKRGILLAHTGANVAVTAGIGFLVLILGAALALRRSRRSLS